MRRIVILILVSVSVLYAHDLWLSTIKDGSYVLRYGHISSAHRGEKNIEYNVDNIKDVVLFNGEGEKVEVAYKLEYPLKIPRGPSVIFVVFSTGYWTKTVEGTKNLSKDKVEIPISSWLSFEYVKFMKVWNNALSIPLTDYLEIVPQDDIENAKVGKKLTFLVTYKRNPVKNVVVAYDGKPIGVTDEKGRINIRIKKKGLQIIQATYKEKADGKKTDEVIHTTTLNWEIK